MRNKLKLILYIFLLIIFNNSSISDEFKVKSNSINVTDEGNIINAIGDVEVESNNNLIIISDRSILDKKKSLVISSGNVFLTDKTNDLKIKSDEIKFNRLENKAIITGNSEIIFEDNYTLSSDKIIYDKNLNSVYSKEKSILLDKNGNIIKFSKFNLDLNRKKAKVFDLNLIDTDKNNFILKEAFVDLNNGEIAGKDLKLFFDKSILGNIENDPRIFGNSVINSKKETIINKGVFTSCKLNEKEKCPPWEMRAEEIKHDKKNKIVEYKNAYLRIYDKPVLYFPFFFHPDPSVKRQSGFLMPKINNSTFLGSSLQIPYYKVISDSEDVTVSPRIFFNDKFLLQSEYRQVFKKSDLILDHSIKLDNENSVTHLFGNFFTNNNNNKFEVNFETVSNRNYLKKYDIYSNLVDNHTILNSYIDFEESNENSSFRSSIEVFEDLTLSSSDSYEFVYPTFNYNSKLNTNLNGNLNLNVSGHQKKYQTNRYDGILVNNLIYNSNKKITKNGFVDDFNLIFKNVNTKGDNSSELKEDYDNKLLSGIVLNREYPLKKINNDKLTFLTPKISARLSPTETKNISHKDKRVDVISLFNTDRLNENTVLEGGESLTLGADYKLSNENGEFFSLSGGQVFRLKEEKDIPKTSTIGNKRSDIVGNLKFIPSEVFNLDYSFSINKDLNDLNYNYAETNFLVNNFMTSFKYLSDSNSIDNRSYISNTTKYSFDKNNSFGFTTNKNLESNLTEYYDLVYEYRNDCLKASVEYKKTFYDDVDLNPDENIFFSITIIPFGSLNTPNLR
tara:strand:- start:403 stop:2766 length:2364 start_codon:yes stop_codon:yes gene_type:complete